MADHRVQPRAWREPLNFHRSAARHLAPGGRATRGAGL